MGSHISIQNDTNDTVMVKIGDDVGALRSAGSVAGSLAAVTAAATSAIQPALTLLGSIQGHLAQEGYAVLGPGQSHLSDKKTLSLLQRCHVVRACRQGSRVVVEHTYMRPIFTGATDGSVATQTVQQWVSKCPYELVLTYESN